MTQQPTPSTTSLNRQFATGIAAFIVTALMVLANAPAETATGSVRLDRAIAVQQAPAASDPRG